jgi:hypothetical protein
LVAGAFVSCPKSWKENVAATMVAMILFLMPYPRSIVANWILTAF